MEISLSTPALLFSAITLLMLAYTNRFLALATLVRGLSDKYMATQDANIFSQIQNLRKRLNLIRSMQISGLASLLLCVVSMLLLYIKLQLWAEVTFGLALLLMILSLLQSIREILISVKALDLHLDFIEKDKH